MPEIAVILNPAARSERAQKASALVHSLAGEGVIRYTDSPGAARRLAAEAAAEGCRIVVAAGGDGTVNEVANGLAGTAAALGVLPVGTMNVFAKELGLPMTMEAAWKVILAGALREIDLPTANENRFVQLAGVGFDAEIVRQTSWRAKRRFGPLAYLFRAAQIASHTAPRLAVDIDGRTREASFLLIGNGRYYGARLPFFPDARLDDGVLDLLVFKNLGYVDLARTVAALLLGRLGDLTGVEYHQARRVTATSTATVPVEIDGELFGSTPVTFQLGDRLRVVVPAR